MSDNLDQELEEMQEWVIDIAKWKLKPRGQYEATCAYCGEKAVYVDMDIDQTIAALQDAGWQLRNEGPSCYSCNLSEEDSAMALKRAFEGFKREEF
jgi:hypothetical protein